MTFSIVFRGHVYPSFQMHFFSSLNVSQFLHVECTVISRLSFTRPDTCALGLERRPITIRHVSTLTSNLTPRKSELSINNRTRSRFSVKSNTSHHHKYLAKLGITGAAQQKKKSTPKLFQFKFHYYYSLF